MIINLILDSGIGLAMKLKDKLKGNQCNIFQLMKYETIAWFDRLEDKFYPLKPLSDCKRCKKCNKYLLKRFASYSVQEIGENREELCICTKKRAKDIEETLSWIELENDNDSESDPCEDCSIKLIPEDVKIKKGTESK